VRLAITESAKKRSTAVAAAAATARYIILYYSVYVFNLRVHFHLAVLVFLLFLHLLSGFLPMDHTGGR
jgi:hypothetical protein